MKLNPDFKDMLSEFNAERVEYMLVGAYAMAAHGVPRYTGDIDFWVRADPDNARRILRALAQFGAPVGDLTEADFCSPDLIYQIGLPPRRIDVITFIDGISFAEAWPRRIARELDGVLTTVIGRDDLLTNKIAANRPKDVVDAIVLQKQKDEGR